jgi:hypothetical protein
MVSYDSHKEPQFLSNTHIIFRLWRVKYASTIQHINLGKYPLHSDHRAGSSVHILQALNIVGNPFCIT